MNKRSFKWILGLLFCLINVFIFSNMTYAASSYVDVYYNSTLGTDTYNNLSAVTSNYDFAYGLANGSAIGLYNKNSGFPSANMLSTSGTNSLTPSIKVSGTLYSPIYNDREAKAYMIRAGKNMWDVRIANIIFKSVAGATLPLYAEQEFYLWNEKFYVKTTWNVTGTIAGIEYAELQTFLQNTYFNKYNTGSGDVTIPASGQWTAGTVYNHVTVFDNNATSHGAFSYQIINKANTESLIMQSGNYAPSIDGRLAIVQRAYDKDKHSGVTTTWYNGESRSMYTQILVSGTNSSAAGIADTAIEMDPLTTSELQVTDSLPYAGSRSLGYDNTMGAYVVQTYTPELDFYKTSSNSYTSAKIQISNDTKARKIRLKTTAAITNPAGWGPAITGGTAILTDQNMVANGIFVQVSKKWDNATGPNINYFDTYASFDMAANVSTTMWHRTSYQNWGDKVNVGLPSLDLSNYGAPWGTLWLETHVGASETMTYNPDDPVNATLADFRAQNGIRPSGVTQGPWFDNSGGWEFLQLWNGTAWIDAKRRGPGIRFKSVGPNLSQYDMTLQTKAGDPNIKVTVTSTLIPSINGSRVFYKIHYDFLSDYTFTNIKKDLTLFSMGDRRYSTPWANTMSYKNSGGAVSTVTVAHPVDGGWDLIGSPLNASKPWVSFYNAQNNNFGFVVLSFSGRFNSTTMNNLGVSMWSYADGVNTPPAGNKQTAYLVPDTSINSIKAGDYADLVVEAFTYNPSQGNYSAVDFESTKWPTAVTMNYGTKLDDFPVRVQVGASQYADFTVTGGVDYLPITVEGFNSYAKPQLEQYVSGAWQVVNQSVGINDGWQTDLDEVTGKYKVTYAVATPDGGTYRYKVSMVTSTAPSFPTSLPTPTWPVGGVNIALGRTYSASSQWDANYTAAKAFDSDVTTWNSRWTAASGASNNQWLKVDFGDYRTYNKVILKEASAFATITSYVLQASNDDITWVNIWGTEGTTIGALPITIDFYPVTSKMLRLYIYTTNGSPTIWEMEAYSSQNLALGKTYSASSVWDTNYTANKAFDQDFTTWNSRWSSASGQSNNQWLAVDLGASTTYRKVVLRESTSGQITSYKLQSSTDNVIWTDISGTTGTTIGPNPIFKEFAPVTSRYFRIYINTANGSPTLWEMEVWNHS